MSSMYSGVYYVVVDSKATLAEIFNLNSSLGEDSVPTMLNNEIDYNLYGSSEDKLAVAKALDKHFEENSVKSDVSGFYEESRDANREQIYVLYGGLFFIGIFLGTMFLMVTVMIIFYKQISEGYDDKARYEIMEKVGMSNDEVKKSITSQVRMVFFLPIILAACHLAAAFPLLRRLLVMFNLTDVKLIAICMSATFLVFVYAVRLLLILAITYVVCLVSAKTKFEVSIVVASAVMIVPSLIYVAGVQIFAYFSATVPVALMKLVVESSGFTFLIPIALMLIMGFVAVKITKYSMCRKGGD